MRLLTTLVLLIILFGSTYPNTYKSFNERVKNIDNIESEPFIIDTANHWVDSVFNSLTLRERIGQLMMISAYSNQGTEHINAISGQIKKYNIGGVIFMKGSPIRQAIFTNHIQSIAKTPLLIAIDGEWGLSMRLDSIKPFPRQMMLGAINNEELIYDMGTEIARQCRLMGIHINFAPVLDINNNPKNPVINSRSFGEDKKQVLRRGYAYMAGMQDNGLLVSAKHFPGHGDTDTDSHHNLPVLNHSRKHLEQNELYPFKHLIDLGLTGIMVAHMHITAFNPSQAIPATLSKEIVTDLLIDKYGFKGIIYTDAMNMGGVANKYKPEEAALMAFKAGNDIILFPPDVEKSIKRIEKAVKNKEIDIKEINRRCKKILGAKFYAHLNEYKPIETDNLIADLQTGETEYLNHSIAAEAITLLSNHNDLIPLQSVENDLYVINIESSENNNFINRAKNYSQISCNTVTKHTTAPEKQLIINKASTLPYVVFAWHGISQYPANNYGVSSQIIEFINNISKNSKVILVVFGNPYVLNSVQTKQINSIIVTYEDNPYTNDYAAQTIFGGIDTKGKLPVSLEEFKVNTGLTTKKTRLGFIHPKTIGADISKLNEIDDLMNSAIINKMTPGAQVLCAKNGYVFYNKNIGYHTYDSIIAVSDNSIYDLASLTKILVTTPLLMHLYEQKKLKLNTPLGHYLPLEPDKLDIPIIDMLAHQAKFKPWIPFYRLTLDDSLNYKPGYYSTIDTGNFFIPVAKNLFTIPEIADTIFHILDTTPLNPKKEYLYSDIPFYHFMHLIEYIEYKEIDELIDSLFYKPLSLNNLKFYPSKHFDIDRIVPTENDTIFRKQLIHGYVHDQGAALLGGKSGHAGLFGNATEVAIFGQMLLNKGEYGNRHYFDKSTVDFFTTAHFANDNNRRGLGFDKPEIKKNTLGPTFNEISQSSYGHTGFTGTYFWIDPEKQIIYVFLSNRIYPDANNKKLSKYNIRTRVHSKFYEAFTQSSQFLISDNEIQ